MKPQQPPANLLSYYYGFANLIDDQVGRMVAHLEATGELDNTYIVFTADHGESLGSHGGLANKGLQVFEETLKVPLIVHGPDIKPGSIFNELVSNMDIHATALDWAGAPLPADAPARSFAGVSRGDAGAPTRDCWVVESHGVTGFCTTQRVLRWGDLSYGWSAGFPELLFDLAADPHQMCNLADDPAHQATLQACRDKLDAWMVEQRDHSRSAYRQDCLLNAS